MEMSTFEAKPALNDEYGDARAAIPLHDTCISEADFVQLARDNPEHFAPIYQQYFPRIFAYCYNRTNSPQEAEDLTSRIFTHALKGLASYRGGSVAAWLFRIAHNTLVSHYRRRHTQVSIEALELDISDTASHPRDRLVQAEEAQQVRDMVATLPSHDQELLALWLDGDLSASEIGKIIGQKEGTVRVKLHRIFKRLRKRCPEELKRGQN
jgi:RNA polymerase sigma-70 factor (ECF subfamily)